MVILSIFETFRTQIDCRTWLSSILSIYEEFQFRPISCVAKNIHQYILQRLIRFAMASERGRNAILFAIILASASCAVNSYDNDEDDVCPIE